MVSARRPVIVGSVGEGPFKGRLASTKLTVAGMELGSVLGVVRVAYETDDRTASVKRLIAPNFTIIKPPTLLSRLKTAA